MKIIWRDDVRLERFIGEDGLRYAVPFTQNNEPGPLEHLRLRALVELRKDIEAIERVERVLLEAKA
jgi:hypothetical protein